ncbi:proteasome subunit beta [Candidatus Woesearchaeota archaeon CG10_big_fil_rev_8_21_14_0_10_44_13]|nr:MAG: proteasome subunit beta [Candidatus Woesearchaeota archaeon CG10_big_fil_rev_8_21_14_0_10_44_13]
MDEKNVTKTGTTTVGLICKDGIILAADKRATMGHFIAGKKMDKIFQIDDSIGITIAGLVSDAQLLVKLIKAELRLKKVRTDRVIEVKEAVNLLAGMTYENIRRMSMVPGIVGFLLGGKDKHGYHLYNIDVSGGITEEDEYTSDGSGSVFAYGVFETLYKKDMSMDEGIKLAVKAVNAALQRDSASGSGIDVITITDKGYQKIMTKEIKTKIEM